MCSGGGKTGSFRNESAQLPVVFSAEALSKGLRAIWEEQIDVRTEIERNIFEETLRLFNEATAQGLSESYDPALITDRFLHELRTNNAVFSAFRTHRMQNDIAAQLIDPLTGQLKSFDRWKLDIKGMTDHYCHAWLQTEYDTAVIRAHQAADWKHFLEEADVFPNIRWMPTTSITPDPLHQHYWEKKLTLPVNHPFWQEHRPGDRWNCKCSLQQTDDPVNASALDGWTPPLPQPGLDNNPAEDGQLFSDTHPYFTEAYPGAAEAVKKAVGDSSYLFEAKTVEEAKQFILDHIAESVDFDFKKSDLENLNPILNQLRERLEDFKLPKFSTFKKSTERNADASVSKDGKSFSLSTAFLRTPDKIYEKLEKFEKKYGYRFRAVANRDDYVRATIDHELGHVLASKYNLSRGVLDRAFSKDLRHKLGYYATTSPDEYFAECIAAYFGPLRKEMTQIELDLVEGFFREHGINIATMVSKAKRAEKEMKEIIQARRATYLKLKADKQYRDVHFDENTGALKATHIEHNFDPKKGDYERIVQDVGFNNGHSVIFESEFHGKPGQRFTEGTWDGLLFEISGKETATAENIKKGLLHCASKRKTEVAIIMLPEGGYTLEKMQRALKMFKGLEKQHDGQYLRFKRVICIQENKIVYDEPF